jgi:hypothetical protein
MKILSLDLWGLEDLSLSLRLNLHCMISEHEYGLIALQKYQIRSSLGFLSKHYKLYSPFQIIILKWWGRKFSFRMLRLILGTTGIVMGFVGVFTNLYILLVLVLHKKVR